MTAAVFTDHGTWHALATVEKFNDADAVEWVTRRINRFRPFSRTSLEPQRADFSRYKISPDITTIRHHNLLVTVGITRMLNLLIAAGGQAYTNTYARIGTSDNAGVTTNNATAGDTDLGGTTNKYFQAMAATYPSVATNVVTFQATFPSGQGNYTWNDWGIDQGGAGSSTSGATVGAPLLNHKAAANLGTKASGSAWTFTATITIS